ncbi:hypothetical protein [Pseudorhodoferax sp. Leaf265]|uniref:hypothetical protein n=1 Tax=Pseudorhodoferax sp. Leaf265 TaxID=1736315 RepID=UPI0012E8A648|nr:hypothetical protein [Pseudorhodoferax sp. Leaf265]
MKSGNPRLRLPSNVRLAAGKRCDGLKESLANTDVLRVAVLIDADHAPAEMVKELLQQVAK